MKEQLDLRVLIIYLLRKLREIGIDNEHTAYIRAVCILLSKQTLFILEQERIKYPFTTLEPNDVSYFLRVFTVKEIAQELQNLLKGFKNIEDEPYCKDLLFDEVQHRYIVSLITSISDRLL